MAPPNWPQLILEGGFTAGPPVQTGAFTLNDAAYGLLDTGTLGTGTAWTGLTAWLRSGTVTRPANRQQGPLWAYQQGTLSAAFANGDGRFDPDNTAGPYAGALTAMVPVRLRATWASVTYPLFAGFADAWQDDGANRGPRYAETTLAASDGQKILSGVHIPPAAAAGAGELTGARITRILNAAGWYTGTGQRVIAPGDSPVQATTMGDTAWSLMTTTADSEIGEVYLDGAGRVIFRNRHAILQDARSTTPQLVLGDQIGNPQAAGTEQAYVLLPRNRDDSTLANDVQATRVGGGAVLQQATDSASVAKYLFARSYARSDLILADDATTLSWAQWVLYVSKGDEDRFDTVTVNPLRDPANLWPQVLGREIGDRIQVWRRPPGVIPTATPWTITSTGDTLGPSYIPVTTADAAKVAIGDQFQLYTSAGAPKDAGQWPLEVVALPAPFLGIVNVTFDKTLLTWVNNADVAVQTGGALVKDAFIRGITHTFDVAAGTWATTWTLQDASKYGSFWTLDQALLGRLDYNGLAF